MKISGLLVSGIILLIVGIIYMLINWGNFDKILYGAGIFGIGLAVISFEKSRQDSIITESYLKEIKSQLDRIERK